MERENIKKIDDLQEYLMQFHCPRISLRRSRDCAGYYNFFVRVTVDAERTVYASMVLKGESFNTIEGTVHYRLGDDAKIGTVESFLKDLDQYLKS